MKKYIGLFWGLVYLALGWGFTNDHFSDDLKRQLNQKIVNLEKLTKTPQKTSAQLDSVYREITVEILHVPVTHYETKYFFDVNNRVYEGLSVTATKPSGPTIEVSYLVDNPAINAVNPAAELEESKEKRSSNFGLYIGVFLLLVGSINLYSFVKNYRAGKKAKSEAQQRVLDEDNQRFGIR